MVTKSILIAFFALAPYACAAQMLEFHSVKKLPAAVNSAGEEGLPIMSPEGQLFFTRALYAANEGGKFSGLDIWSAEASAGDWKHPRNDVAGSFNTEGHNALIGISRDGKKRYFMSAAPNEKVNGIYVSSRVNNYWSRPDFVPIPGIDNQNFLGMYVSPDFDVILFSMKGPDSRGEEDLYFSVKNSVGQWSPPKSLGATINTRGFEISPFLSPDKKRLYFASNGHGGEGDADIFYSDRLYNSWETWSLPVNLGKEVNSKKFDAYFSMAGDSIGYFASNRDGRYADLYEVRVRHGRTVLQPGQQYLSREEWNRTLGGAVSNEVVFTPRKIDLSASQKELLFYIANRLQLQKGIMFHLVVREEEAAEFTKSRLQAITDHLVQSGIADERIIIEQVESAQRSRQGRIEIRMIE